MGKKIIANLLLIMLAAAALFGISYFLSYKVTTNAIKVKNAGTSADWAGEEQTAADETEPVTAAPTLPAADVPLTGAAAVLPTPEEIEMPAGDGWMLVLINRYYRLKEDYEPTVTQVMSDSAVYLDSRVAQAFQTMYSAALADGIELTLSAGYVTPERQARKFNQLVKSYTDMGLDAASAAARAAFTVSPAYCSESNYGLAVEIGWPEEDFARSPTYGWLRENAARFGFIERYPADKTDFTLFHAEPWHWRYVGNRAALEMREQGLCLEEYVGSGSAAALIGEGETTTAPDEDREEDEPDDDDYNDDYGDGYDGDGYDDGDDD